MSAESVVSNTNPFPGLRPFQESEQHLFFGRESQVDAMVDKLSANRFLAVVGTSGSGKSSLVNCGLRPALRTGLMASAGTDWRMAQIRPGGEPIHALSRALAADGVLFKNFVSGGLPLEDIVDTTLRMSKLGLVDIVEQAQLAEGVNLLLVIDQFEELFRYRHLDSHGAGQGRQTSEEATAFVNLLLAAVENASIPIYIVITMRSDFLGDCAQFSGLAEAINAGQYLVPRMSREQRRAAITGPIGVGGARIDSVLLTRLVNDVGDNPDQLSILQHALNRTWSYWENLKAGKGMLDLDAYKSIGSMSLALDQHAEKAYAELGTAKQKRICEVLFKALTDKATDVRGVRRPTTLAILCALADASEEEVVAVIDVFRKPSRSFLMPPAGVPVDSDTVVDISHESLMRVWQRLDGWADEEAEDARRYRRLAETATLYQRKDAGLLRDPDLRVALQWRKRSNPNASWAQRYDPAFVDAMAFLRKSEKSDLMRRRMFQGLLVALACLPIGLIGYKWQTEVASAQNKVSNLEQTIEVQNEKIEDAEDETVLQVVEFAMQSLPEIDRQLLNRYVNDLLEKKREAVQSLAAQVEIRDDLKSEKLSPDEKDKLIEKASLKSNIRDESAYDSIDNVLSEESLAAVQSIVNSLEDNNRNAVINQIKDVQLRLDNALDLKLEVSAEIDRLKSNLLASADAPDGAAASLAEQDEADSSIAAAVEVSVNTATPAESKSADLSATTTARVDDGFVVCEYVNKLEPQKCQYTDAAFRPGRVYLFARVVSPKDAETLSLRWMNAGKVIAEKKLRVEHNPAGYRTYSWKTFNNGSYSVCLYDQTSLEIGCLDFTVNDSESGEPAGSLLALNEPQAVPVGNTTHKPNETGIVVQSQTAQIESAKLQAPVVSVQTLAEPAQGHGSTEAEPGGKTQSIRFNNSKGDGFVVCEKVIDNEPQECTNRYSPGRVYVFARIVTQSDNVPLLLNWYGANDETIASKQLTVDQNSAGYRIHSWKSFTAGSYKVCLSDLDGNKIRCAPFTVSNT